MANPIQSNDLANKDVFKNLTDGAKELIGLIDKLTAETKEFGAEAEKIAKGLDFSKTSDIAKLNKLLADLTKNTENVTEAQKQRKKTSDAVNKAEQERLKSLAKTQKDVEKRLKEIEKDKEKRGLQAIKSLEKEQKAQLKALEAEKKRVEATRLATKEFRQFQKTQDATVFSIEELERATKVARKEVNRLQTAQGEQTKESQEALRTFAKLNATLTDTRKRLRDATAEEKDLKTATEAAENSYEAWGAAIRKARRELVSLDTTLPKNQKRIEELQNTINQNVKRQNQFNESIGNFRGNVGNYQSALDGIGGSFGGIVGAAGPAAAGVAAVAAAFEAFKLSLELTRQVNAELERTSQLTGVTGSAAGELRDRITGLANTFSKDFNEVLIASNNLAKQFGIEQDAALDLIESGFIRGADASGDFLEKVKEYGIQFRESGFSAEEFIQVATQEVKGGIFNDKLLDSVKELGLSLRELDKAQTDALTGAFGEAFTTQLQKGLETGAINTKQALQLIGDEAERVGLNVKQTQTLTADLFKGAGEDAGGFAEIIKQVNTAFDEGEEDLTEYQKGQQAIIESNEELSEAQRRLVEDIGLNESAITVFINDLKILGIEILGILKDAFGPFVDVLKTVFNATKEVFMQLGLVNKETSLLGSIVKISTIPIRILGQVLQGIIKLWKGFKEGVGIVTDVLTGDFSSALERTKQGFENLKVAIVGTQTSVTDFFNNVRKVATGFLPGQIEKAGEALTKFGEDAKKAGESVFNFLVSPITSLFKTAEDKTAAKNLAQLRAELNTLKTAREQLTATDLEAIKTNKTRIADTEKEIEQLEILLGIRKREKEEQEEEVQQEREVFDETKFTREQLEERRKRNAAFLELGELQNDATEKQIQEFNDKKAKIESDFNDAILDIDIKRLKAQEMFLQKQLDDESLTAEERERIQKELFAVQSELSDKELELLERNDQKAAESRQKRLDDIAAQKAAQQELLDQFVQGVNVVNDLLNDLSEKRIEQINNEIDALNRREDQVRESYEQGSKFATQSITAIDEERRRLEEEREKQFRQEAARELFVAGANVLAETGDINEALRQLAILSASIPAFVGGFHDGGYTGDGNEYAAAGIVHKGEHVITKEQTGKYGLRHLSADDFDRAVETGYFTQFANPEYLQYDQLRPTVSTTLDQSQVINRLERVEDAILLTIDKKPQHNQAWDEMRKEMVYEISTRTKVERKRRKGFRY